MAATWVLEEMQTVDMPDARIEARLYEVLTQLGERPCASIPAACGGHAEMTAAYRLFDNPRVTFEGILRPHAAATRKRMAAQSTVLMAQDTSEMDVTRPAQQVRGAGPLDGGARWGLLLHPLHAFTPDGTPLGTLKASVRVRPDEERAPQTRAQRAAIPIENKESYRWLETLRAAQAEAELSPATHFIGIADSEADIYELLAEAQAEPRRIDWIVRACQDRALEAEAEAEAAGHLREEVLAQPVWFTNQITVRGREPKIACEKRGRRQARKTRQALVEVRSARVTLRPPWRADRKLPALAVNVVLVREAQAPLGEEPVEWLLLTSLPVGDAEQVREVIRFYCVRWMIEILFRVLKSGCRVEARRFENIERVQRCLAVYLIVAWRTLYVCRLGRSCPDISCEAIFEPQEWKPVWKVLLRSDPPATPPTLGEMTLLVAELGGYIRRKDSPPGPQTVWIGLQRMYDFAICWKTFGPESGVSLADV